jgi:hypothetical protein
LVTGHLEIPIHSHEVISAAMTEKKNSQLQV